MSSRSAERLHSTRYSLNVVRNAVQSGVDKAFDVTESILSSDLEALKVNIERDGYKTDKKMKGEKVHWILLEIQLFNEVVGLTLFRKSSALFHGYSA